MTGTEVLDKLRQGNGRFVAGKSVGAEGVDLAGMVDSQSPIAAILCCSDSRVPPEYVFDQGVGDIFVVRVAGNIAGLSELGRLEYAVAHLKTPLLLVLGHEGCGAVKASLAGSAEGAIGKLIEEIAPAVRPVLEQSEEAENVELEAIKANIWHTMGKLVERSKVIEEAVRGGDVSLMGAVYSLETGSVTILTEDGY
jgi:carbonic anhydrase